MAKKEHSFQVSFIEITVMLFSQPGDCVTSPHTYGNQFTMCYLWERVWALEIFAWLPWTPGPQVTSWHLPASPFPVAAQKSRRQVHAQFCWPSPSRAWLLFAFIWGLAQVSFKKNPTLPQSVRLFYFKCGTFYLPKLSLNHSGLMLIRSIKQFKILHNLRVAESINKVQTLALVLRCFFLVHSFYTILISRNHLVFLLMPPSHTLHFHTVPISIKINQLK